MMFATVFPHYHPKSGQKFNRLTFLEELDSVFQKNGNRKRYGLFRCDCGIEKRILIYSVTSGAIVSCTCYGKQIRGALAAKRNLTHGLSKHPLYSRWRKIKDRCLNIKNKRYLDYGGRGIGICEEWNNNFVAFYNWALNNGYSALLEIDREDNDKGYSPDNCRFVTGKINANNTRRNIIVMVDGRELSLMEACESIGVGSHYRMIWESVKKGNSFSEAIKKYQ